MAWDTERTKRLLLDAAVEEFAEHGPEGARVDRVATRAGVNKERIYQYFGSKRRLFDAVLTAELAKVAAAVPLSTEQAVGDIGEYAGRVFDYYEEHPHFVRLLCWEGLHDDPAEVPAAADVRLARYADKRRSIAEAQRAGSLVDEVSPGAVFYAVLALASWWYAVPQVARMILADTDDTPASRREALVRLARRLTSAAA